MFLDTEAEAMKILGSTWFTEMGGLVGIVVVDTGFEEKAYIGAAAGYNESEDEQTIAARGAKFPLSMAKELCGLQ